MGESLGSCAPLTTEEERKTIIDDCDQVEASYVNTMRTKTKHLKQFKLRREREWLKKRKAAQYRRVKDNFDMKNELRGWFNFLDKDGSGEITVDELEDPLISMGLAKVIIWITCSGFIVLVVL
jgi:hypothetical protein